MDTQIGWQVSGQQDCRLADTHVYVYICVIASMLTYFSFRAFQIYSFVFTIICMVIKCWHISGQQVSDGHVDRYMLTYIMAIRHPADLLTGLIMYKGLHIHLSVWIYEWVGRYLGSRWPDRHVYIDLYILLPANPSFYFSSRIYLQGLLFILACINIDLYGY